MHPILYLVDHMMIPILQYGYQLTGNYGMAIILVTIILKMLLFPLTIKQTQSMAGMKKVQPLLKEIQDKHKDNPQMMQVKMMELYKEHQINPFGGCLPTLVQLPFFIAIFVSLSSKQFKALLVAAGAGPSSFFWVSSLSLPDKTMILPVLVAASTYVSQKTMMTGASKDDPQMKMFAYMPILMLFIAMNMPSGVLLYWAISQFITAGQQALIAWHADNPKGKKGAK